MGYRIVTVSADQRDRYLAEIGALVEAERVRPGSLIVAQEPEFYARYCGSSGATIVALDGDNLIGFALLAFPERFTRSGGPTPRDLAPTSSAVVAWSRCSSPASTGAAGSRRP
jgi:hypothetical protein